MVTVAGLSTLPEATQNGLLRAEANNSEDPGTVILHAGVCEGQSGNWP